MDQLASEALEARLAALELALHSFGGRPDALQGLKLSLSRFDTIVAKLNAAGLLDAIDQARSDQRPPTLATDDHKVIISSRSHEMDVFLNQFDQILGMLGALEAFECKSRQLRQINSIDAARTLQRLDRLYAKYQLGVARTVDLLERRLALTYERNQFLGLGI